MEIKQLPPKYAEGYKPSFFDNIPMTSVHILKAEIAREKRQKAQEAIQREI